MRLHRAPFVLVPLLATPASAQFSDFWAEFVPAPELLSSGQPISNPSIETDLDWADLDQDGGIDLVVVRKEPILGDGKFRNVLLMNQGGVLVNESVALASASDVPGDAGFLSPTCDSDVEIVDVDGDGWDDVITAATQSDGDPKHVSHPRVYRNLGVSGTWQGLRHEGARIPQLIHATNGNPVTPRFNAVTSGDVDADGFNDLYFADIDSLAGSPFGPFESPADDSDDRLLRNDGTGFFVDVTAAAMTTTQVDSEFANSAVLADMNLDGTVDVLKQTSHTSPVSATVAYNNPASVGDFVAFAPLYSGAPYFVNTGDLNNDGRLDVVISDNGADGVVYNLGTAGSGLINWSGKQTYDFLSGADDSFASNNLAVDIDGDGWNDVLHADIDPEIPGTSRRTHIYHNRGGTVGGTDILLREERESASDDDWIGVGGPTRSDLQGTHDIAVFDIDGDGRNEIILSRHSGTDVWRQVEARVCQTDLGFGTGAPVLRVCGGDLSFGNDALLELIEAPPLQFAYLVLAAQSNPAFVPSLQATFAAQPFFSILTLATDANGELAFFLPGGLGNISIVMQCIVANPGPGVPFTSNAIRVDFQP